jgi:hypothetical protein
MAGQIIISNIKTDSDNAFSILANTGAVLFSANLESGITTGIADGSVTNAKLAGSITTDKIVSNPAFLGNTTTSGTGFTQVASGTTTQRPTSPNPGMFRYNTTTNETEVYSGIGWTTVSTQTYTLSYLIVAGAGGAGQVVSFDHYQNLRLRQRRYNLYTADIEIESGTPSSTHTDIYVRLATISGSTITQYHAGTYIVIPSVISYIPA